LPDALRELPDFDDVEELRVHFHVPLFFAARGRCNQRSPRWTNEFFHLLRGGDCPHLEIETYYAGCAAAEVHPAMW